MGVAEGRVRKWILSINAFLRNQNGSIPDAVALWKVNVDQEFRGLEECLICYSIVHAQTGQLPRLKCRTCARRFHGEISLHFSITLVHQTSISFPKMALQAYDAALGNGSNLVCLMQVPASTAGSERPQNRHVLIALVCGEN